MLDSLTNHYLDYLVYNKPFSCDGRKCTLITCTYFYKFYIRSRILKMLYYLINYFLLTNKIIYIYIYIYILV